MSLGFNPLSAEPLSTVTLESYEGTVVVDLASVTVTMHEVTIVGEVDVTATFNTFETMAGSQTNTYDWDNPERARLADTLYAESGIGQTWGNQSSSYWLICSDLNFGSPPLPDNNYAVGLELNIRGYENNGVTIYYDSPTIMLPEAGRRPEGGGPGSPLLGSPQEAQGVYVNTSRPAMPTTLNTTTFGTLGTTIVDFGSLTEIKWSKLVDPDFAVAFFVSTDAGSSASGTGQGPRVDQVTLTLKTLPDEQNVLLDAPASVNITTYDIADIVQVDPTSVTVTMHDVNPAVGVAVDLASVTITTHDPLVQEIFIVDKASVTVTMHDCEVGHTRTLSGKLPTVANIYNPNSDATWTNPSNALTNDGSYAHTIVNNDNSADLHLTGFDFGTLPLDATIKGINVTVDGWIDNISGNTFLNTQLTIREFYAPDSHYFTDYPELFPSSASTFQELETDAAWTVGAYEHGDDKGATSLNWIFNEDLDIGGGTGAAALPENINDFDWGISIFASTDLVTDVQFRVDYVDVDIRYFSAEDLVEVDNTPSVTITTYDIDILEGPTVVDLASVTVTTYDPNISETIPVDLASVTVTTYDVEIDQSIIPDTASVTITTYDPVIDEVYILSDVASVAVTTYDVKINESVIPDNLVNVTVTTYDPKVTVTVPVDTLNITVTTYDPVLDEIFLVDLASVTITTHTADVFEGEEIEVDKATVTVTTYDPVLDEFFLVDKASVNISTQDVVINDQFVVDVDLLNNTITPLDPTVNDKDVELLDLSNVIVTTYDPKVNQSIIPDTPSVAVTTNDVNINDEHREFIDLLNNTVTPYDVDVNEEFRVTVDLLSNTVTAYDPVLNEEFVVPVDLASVNVNTFVPNITDIIPVDLQSVVVSMFAANINEQTRFIVDKQTITVEMLELVINDAETIGIDQQTVTITPFDPRVGEDTNFTIDKAVVTSTFYDPLVDTSEFTIQVTATREEWVQYPLNVFTLTPITEEFDVLISVGGGQVLDVEVVDQTEEAITIPQTVITLSDPEETIIVV